MKLAYWHFGKCAGQFLIAQFRQQGFEPLNSWVTGIERDWNEEECEFIADEEHFSPPLFVNHHLNLSESLLHRFKSRNWVTFGTYRDPRDIICSLYFYGQKLIQEKRDSAGAPFHSHGVLAGHLSKNLWECPDVTKITLSECIVQLVERPELHRFWELPFYMKQLDYLIPACENGFSRLFIDLGLSYHSAKRINVSGNEGFFTYEKILSDKALSVIQASEKLQKSIRDFQDVSRSA